MTKFETGKKYFTRSICDSDCIWTFEVIKRTAKRITIQNGSKVSIVGVNEYDGAELCYPLGRYSMSPILRADREVQHG